MNQSKLYHLIVDPQYRVWRHALLIFALGIITFNQIFIAYQDCLSLLGNKIYLICLASFITYVVAMYVNYLLLIPKLLLKEKYIKYIVLLILLVFLLLLVNIFMEYATRTFLELPHRIKSYINPLILVDSLSSSMITIICFWSMSTITLLRKWTQKNEVINELEYQFFQSQINKLKGQVSSDFLSKALRRASKLAKVDPQRASQILMQLGQLLRYQLYDCDREKVLLGSEISFITNFLKLKILVDDKQFNYSIETKGNSRNILISPLLLIVLVQAILANEEIRDLGIIIEQEDQKISFVCDFQENCILKASNIAEIKEKLEALYPDLYILNIHPRKVELQLNVE